MQRMIKTLGALGVFLFTILLNGQFKIEIYKHYQQQADEIFTKSLMKGHAINILNTFGFDSVYKQLIYVPHWTRGKVEYLDVQSKWLIKYIGDSTVQKSINKQRYFDIHHSETDVFESVNKREL